MMWCPVYQIKLLRNIIICLKRFAPIIWRCGLLSKCPLYVVALVDCFMYAVMSHDIAQARTHKSATHWTNRPQKYAYFKMESVNFKVGTEFIMCTYLTAMYFELHSWHGLWDMNTWLSKCASIHWKKFSVFMLPFDEGRKNFKEWSCGGASLIWHS